VVCFRNGCVCFGYVRCVGVGFRQMYAPMVWNYRISRNLSVLSNALACVIVYPKLPLNYPSSIESNVPDIVASMCTVQCIRPQPSTHHPIHLIYSLAFSATVPIFNFGEYFFNTLSLWYFQNCFVASFPATRFRILAPPGCSSTNPVTSYTFSSTMIYKPASGVLWLATSATEKDFDILTWVVVNWLSRIVYL